MHCCERCQIYWTCETKWFMGERDEKNICCGTCNFYTECLVKTKGPKEHKKQTSTASPQ
ncbi:MAG: hypothetical protein ABH825_00705 [Candidatus Omnitrophota bacterium]